MTEEQKQLMAQWKDSGCMHSNWTHGERVAFVERIIAAAKADQLDRDAEIVKKAISTTLHTEFCSEFVILNQVLGEMVSTKITIGERVLYDPNL